MTYIYVKHWHSGLNLGEKSIPNVLISQPPVVLRDAPASTKKTSYSRPYCLRLRIIMRRKLIRPYNRKSGGISRENEIGRPVRYYASPTCNYSSSIANGNHRPRPLATTMPSSSVVRLPFDSPTN